MNEEYLKEEDFKDNQKEKKSLIFTRFLESSWWTISVVILVAIIAFSWGKYSNINSDREPVKILYPSTSSGQAPQATSSDISKTSPKTTQAAAVITSSGTVVGSKNSTKYHYPWCAGAKQITPQNLITFNSTEEARGKGYTPAANCKGLK
ncbi:MAG: hypothetical protein AAB861_01830 [Patescibacteria group bacterium]